MKLYRAAQDDYLGTTGDVRCFAADIDDARTYLDNPGFGGATLYRLLVDIDPETVIDTRDEDGLARFCEIIGVSADDLVWMSPGRPVEAIHRMENVRMVEALAAAGVRWLVHEDSYPEECETWTMIVGDWADDLEMDEIC